MKFKSMTYGALAATLAFSAAVANAQDADEAAARNGGVAQQAQQQEQEPEPQVAARQPDEPEERSDREKRRDEDVEQRRAELIREADEALARLRRDNPAAAELMDQSYGYAVFTTTKAGLLVTGAGGSGVARPSADGEPTFMHLGSAGVGLGVGVENYKLVLLLQDEQTYRDFVTGQWDGSLSAQAAAGGAAASAEEQFLGGIRAYRVTDRGVMAQIDVVGTRFWVSQRLNDEQALERVAAIDEELEEAERAEAERAEAEQQIATGEDERTVR